MDIVVDFDGTVVTHDYPRVGKDIGSVPVLKELVDNGHQLVLFTMRDKTQLKDAVDWFKSNDIPLFGIQTNPSQSTWTSSPKAYGSLIIDDAALGAPLMRSELSSRPYFDWVRTREMLVATGLIK
jgi:hypothetical protein